MHVSFRTLFAIIILNSFSLTAQQDFKIEDDFLLFEEANTGLPILMYNDSMAAKGFDFKTNFKTQFPIGLTKKNFNKYKFQINSTNYLVDDGCGPVIEFKDTVFVRRDNSFKHRNQYKGVPFTYNNTIYLWGGYGLFTHKNILTTYSQATKEWNFIDAKNSNLIKPRQQALSILIEDRLYVFGGSTNHTTDLNFSAPILNDTLYYLDLKTMTWHKGKPIELANNVKWLENRYFTIDKKLYILNTNHVNITEIDLLKNTVKTYKKADSRFIRSIVYHAKTAQVSYVYEGKDDKLYVISQPFKDFKGEQISSTPFYKPTTYTYLITYGLGSIFILLLLYTAYRLYNNFKITEPILIFERKKQSFRFKNKTIALNATQRNILKKFATNHNAFTPLTELNDIINLDYNNDNHTTVLKRREVIIKDLVTELSVALSIPKDDILITQRQAQDRRIKEIKFNFKIKTKA
ncbi:MAG: hypothetical protein ABF246_05830 [Winogradskyella sp.]